MKHIKKGQEPTALSRWRDAVNDSQKLTYADLKGSPKRALKEALMDEQGHLCCYCERRLSDDDSHIEHFRPQSDPATDSLDYANMLCSCQDQLQQGEPRHCGHRKDDWFDDALLISPLDPDCESQFAFTGDGHIAPMIPTDRAAIETIEHLGLNIAKLRDLRASTIAPFLDETLNEDDMRQFVSGYLKTDDKRPYGEFWTTILYLFGGYAAA